MNNQDKQDLVNYRLLKAKNTLAEVELLIQNKLWNNAVGRLYYACYYAVSALLIDNSINSKTHTGARQMFGKNFVEPGIVKNESGKVFSKLFGMRQRGDYDDFIDFEEKDVLPLIKPATDLVAEIDQILKQK